jgi:CubicO group peptidase (beta-lactamase class C family)
MRRLNKIIVLFFFISTLTIAVPAQESDRLTSTQIEQIESAVQHEMEQQQIVGASVGIVMNGKVVYVKGFGFADQEKQRPATENTIYNWASNSKPIMAIAAMQLVESKQLDLDADIRVYVPEFPEKDGVVTARLLLCHQSGIPHYTNGRIVPLNNEASSDPLAELDPIIAINRFGGSPLLYKPGEGYSYSSYAYVLLSAVVQRAGKMPIAEQIDDRIIKRIGMKSFQLDLPFDNQAEWTVAYFRNREGKIGKVNDIANFWKHGAGGYKSNVSDFARWAQSLVNTALISPETQKEMWTVQKTKDGKPTTYGLGFAVSGSTEGALRVGHSGSQEETKSSMGLLPAKKQAIVVMCNTAHATPIRIADAIEKILDTKGNE